MSEKLQKVLANAGLGSRREIEKWIADGRVKVNGVVAPLGERVSDEDTIHVDNKRVRLSPKRKSPRVILYNKPEGEVCTRKDPEGRPTVFDRLPNRKGERWISVGRLDINTSGLLLLTTDGELANRLMHPSSRIDREYAVRIKGEVDDDMLQRLREGVLLEDGLASFSDIQRGRDATGSNQWFYVVMMEGRYREVRRLWESQGVQVSRLKRVRYGPVFMPSTLSVGKSQEMPASEVNMLLETVGLPAAAVETPSRRRK